MKIIKLLVVCLWLVNLSQVLGQAALPPLGISLKGQARFSSDYLQEIAGWRNIPSYSDKLMEAGIEKILALYEDSGYPYCQVLIEQLGLNPGQEMELKLKIIEGPEVRINQVEIPGLAPHLKNALLREMDFHPGEVYSQKLWEKRQKQLKNLAYLKPAGKIELLPTGDYSRATLSVPVEERKNNSFTGILGYAPGTSSRPGNVTGNLSLELSNFLGGIRQANIVWSKKDQSSYFLNFAFTEHYLWGTPLSARLDFKQSQTDSSYSQIQIAERTSLYLNRHLSLYNTLGWEEIYQKAYLKNIFPSSRKFWLGLGISWNSLDYKLNPRAGFDLEGEVRLVNWQKSDTLTTQSANKKDRQLHSRLSLWNFLPLWDKQTLGIKFAYWQISSEKSTLSPADLFKLGGLNSLRGYLSDQFWTDRAYLTTLEYRFLFSDEARVYIFTDMARFRQTELGPGGLVQSSKYKLGYGVGLWFPSQVGLLNLDLGLGQSDPVSDLKIHLGLKNSF